MKREREVDHSITLANCLMLLSRGGQFDNNYASYGGHRVFECKTCNRQFPSFQALGGHRASHKKPRAAAAAGELEISRLHLDAKPKTHECPICGMEFAIGQALGGHMRRHRDRNNNNNNNNNNGHKTQSSTITLSSSSSGSSLDSRVNGNNKRERVLSLDLNLTPFENDLEFLKIGIANSV